MSDSGELSNVPARPMAWLPPKKHRLNPYELGLGIGGWVALLGGIVISFFGTAAYQRESDVNALANSLAGAYQGSASMAGLSWATFGNQLSTIGVVVILGMAFYAMVRWNKENSQ